MIKSCTKDVHVNFNGTTYIQKDGVAMASPLAPVLADIFMVELQRTLISKISQHLEFWKRYINDTIHCFRNRSQKFV